MWLELSLGLLAFLSLGIFAVAWSIILWLDYSDDEVAADVEFYYKRKGDKGDV